MWKNSRSIPRPSCSQPRVYEAEYSFRTHTDFLVLDTLIVLNFESHIVGRPGMWSQIKGKNVRQIQFMLFFFYVGKRELGPLYTIRCWVMHMSRIRVPETCKHHIIPTHIWRKELQRHVWLGLAFQGYRGISCSHPTSHRPVLVVERALSHESLETDDTSWPIRRCCQELSPCDF